MESVDVPQQRLYLRLVRPVPSKGHCWMLNRSFRNEALQLLENTRGFHRTLMLHNLHPSWTASISDIVNFSTIS